MSSNIAVLQMTEAHIEGVASLLRAHLTQLAYPFDMGDELLRARIHYSLTEAGGLTGGEYAKYRRFRHWVALRGDRVAGALHAYAATPNRPAEDSLPGHIVWMLYDPECARAGAALLREAAIWLGDDWANAEAFSLSNSLGWGGGLPPAWAHVDSALREFGFEPVETHRLMWGAVAADLRADQSPLVQQVCVTAARIADGWRFDALLSGEKVGELCIEPMDRVCWIPSWDQGWWIDWVEVAEPHRGKGIGKRLFLEMARDLARKGYSRIAGYTSSPEAAALNRWVGMDGRLKSGRTAGRVESNV